MKWLVLLFALLCFACSDYAETNDAGGDLSADDSAVTEAAPSDVAIGEVEDLQQAEDSVNDLSTTDQGEDQ